MNRITPMKPWRIPNTYNHTAAAHSLRLFPNRQNMYCMQYDSPLGKLLLTCREDGLTGIWFDREPAEPKDHPVLRQTKDWLDGYFRGEPPRMEIPLALEGTPFQRQVWQLLLTIPYGEVRSYGSLAREIAVACGKEKMSAQAVGQAVGKNPVSILIPCHRIVGSQGQLTGYASGLDRKIWLLHHEGWQIENDIVR